MKKLAALFAIIIISQMGYSQKNNASFDSLWQQVKKLENEGLTKSALKVVTAISEKAAIEKNPSQTVKALLYKSKYALTLEEDAQLKIVNDFNLEIEKADFPTKNILQSYLANLYWQYFQQNRYQFYNRTKTTTKVDAVDFRTWDLTTLFHEISGHFEASLSNEIKLKSTPISEFKAILNTYKGSDIYRPTLFDLLAQNALVFYSSGENSITRPADKFEIDNPKYLSDTNTFANLNITTTDETSLQAKALCIYQQLLLLHLPSKEPYTLAEVNIQRLKYVYQNTILENKDQLYLAVLEKEASSKNTSAASSLYYYEKAVILNQQGDSYQPKSNEITRWKKKEALQLCESIIEDFPESRGSELAKSLKTHILAKRLELTAEEHIPTNTKARLLVHYANYDELKLLALPISRKQLNALEDLYEQEKKLAFIKKLAVSKSWESTLKNEKDFQMHKIEIVMPGLENGHYLILATPFDTTDKTFSYTSIQVTNLALIETQTNTHQEYQVIDRETGRPISNAKLTFRYRLNYDGKFLNKSFYTNTLGTVSIERTEKQWNNISISITHKSENAYYAGFNIYRGYNNEKNSDSYNCFLFTDRSIYRPGQPIYFKGIGIQSSAKNPSLLVNKKITVELNNVNGQMVHKADFKTNEYGSFSGEFIIPNDGLTGPFSLYASSSEYNLGGYTSISVEEYKRPKFETVFEPITDTYKVNDRITVLGNASAFAGSSITDAKVIYRVKRTVHYPRWYYRDISYYNATPQEIKNGETTTDASGKYTINFKAIPDNTTSKTNSPTFSYEITADVTDINGETHSATTIVTVGYHTLTARMLLSNLIDKDDKDQVVTISTNNLNGQFVPAQGIIKMYKLKAPEYVLKPRKWNAPDYAGLTITEFKKLFPHDAFKEEHLSSNWEKGELVWQSKFDTKKSRDIALGNIKNWASGKYILELETKDKFGQEVKDVLETTLFSEKDKTLADNQLFQIKTDKNSYAIGEKVKVTLLSNADDVYITVNIEKNKKAIDTKIIYLSKNARSFTIPIDQDDLGGFSISYSYSVYNYFQSGTLNIYVPYPRTDLQIETVTFRDKIQPGTTETWSFKIKGPEGDKVSAELLASMYDASLDVFKGHYWGFNPLSKPTFYSTRRTNAYRSYNTTNFRTFQDNFYYYTDTNPNFDSFNMFGLYFGYTTRIRGYASGMMRKSKSSPIAAMDVLEGELDEVAMDSEVTGTPGASTNISSREEDEQNEILNQPEDSSQQNNTSEIQIRKNLQETAFFFPQLQTDKEGNVSFSFNTPEALTKWNLQLLAHTKKIESSITTLQTVTQKELMVVPNAPRFLREGDEIVISTKIVNLTNNILVGKAKLKLLDAVSGKDISEKLISSDNKLKDNMTFKVDSMGNTQVSWRLKIPDNIQAVQYTVTAKAGDFSDGEQNVLPVLTNRTLVTETLPMWVRSKQTKTFSLDKLKNTTSKTLKHHKLTLEMTSNPAWYAVQVLPYLMEYPYECNEQTFSRYYANTLASYIANTNPRIQEVFKQWANADALLSNLEKNQELKSLLIQETPWLRDAESETQQKKRIALLFNLNKMNNEQTSSLNKLIKNQKSSGAWAWFHGGPDSRSVTQHIIAGFGHLEHLGALESMHNGKNANMLKDAITYLDAEFVSEYENMKKRADDLNANHLSSTQIHYLYMRSFYKDIKSSKKVQSIQEYYKGQAEKYWKKQSLYSKGMLALIMHREGDTKTAEKILKALEENSITTDELGMYWKSNTNSWHWYQAPIETQALLVEAFSEIHPEDIATIDNLKIWLLKNKQTNQWKTTKATTEAVYALLLQGSQWLSVKDAVNVLVGNEKLEPSKLDNVKVEAGTGYYKTSWNGKEVTPKMAEVQLSKKGDGIAWGAFYWQYFENLDKITSAETPLQLKKQLFLKKNTSNGEEISEINVHTNIEVGDLVRVRIELRADRPMEFVHMKDMRAASFEPVNVISRYKWQDGLGYYEATKDASTNFFFDYVPKGVFVFEYDVRVNNAGNFSNGITTIQSMYAPEFSSHSEGVRVSIKGE